MIVIMSLFTDRGARQMRRAAVSVGFGGRGRGQTSGAGKGRGGQGGRGREDHSRETGASRGARGGRRGRRRNKVAKQLTYVCFIISVEYDLKLVSYFKF